MEQHAVGPKLETRREHAKDLPVKRGRWSRVTRGYY
jgi:hypothetical protein